MATDLSAGTILVTGGAGFIGSALVWALNRRGLSGILITDILGSDEKWRNLVALQYRDYMEATDLLDKLDSLPKLSCIFHLGACSATTERNATYLIKNNFEYTKTLAEFALSRGTRFVYASSAATYGALSGVTSETIPLETLRPLNMYGYSKHMFDLWARRSGILQDITGVKYFNIYGPNENHKGEMRSLVNKAYDQIQRTGRMSLFRSHRPDYKDGEQQRDFFYVKDAVEATIHLAERVDGGGLFNLGSAQANTWIALANAIFAALGKPPQIDFVDMPEHLREKYQYFTCADISKLRATGFTHTITPLRDAVADYVQVYLSNDKRLGDE